VFYNYILAFIILLANSPLNEMQKAGKEFGKQNLKSTVDEIENFSTEDLKPKTHTEFDPEIAKQELKNQQITESELLNFLKSEEIQRNYQTINTDEYYFKRSEEISSQKEFSSKQEIQDDFYALETCLEAGAPFTFSIVRNLELNLEKNAKKRTDQVCLGHHKEELLLWGSKRDAAKWIDEEKAKLSLDGSLQSFDAYVKEHCRGEYYLMRSEWKHCDNCSNCTTHTPRETIEDVIDESGEKWSYENQNAQLVMESPDASLIEKICLDSSPKIINGKEFQKQCWKEKLIYLCRHPKTKGCNILREKNCQEIHRQCLEEGEFGCSLWEITYKCFSKVRQNVPSNTSDMFGMESENCDTAYEPNTSFANVATKLSLFDEMKKDIEEQNAIDATKIQIFKGKEMSCSKSVADDLLYDCCFAFGGIAKKLKLSQCNEEEISLSEMRENGLCHYVGKYSKDFLGMWKSRDEHVYCCFSSKLSKIFQEEARNQLSINWGSAKNPDCRGLITKEIDSLDFTKLDLSEAYDKPSAQFNERLQEKLEKMQPIIKERIENEARNGII
jgi:conjugal transfer mating pair stabilization protein TraN